MANLRQERHAEYVSGTFEQFVVTSQMTAAAIPTELPHLNIFVYKIVDPLDAKRDTFQRVARISDLTALIIGRAAAVSSKPDPTGLEYTQTSSVVSYPTLDQAEAGKQAIIDRCNALVNDWISFNADFNAPNPTPANITLPTTDASQLQALINAYKAAKEDRYNKGLTRAAANQTVLAAQAAYTQAQGDVTAFTPLVAQSQNLQIEQSSSLTFLQALIAAGNTFFAAAGCAAAPDLAAFQAALNVGTNNASLMTTYVADHAAAVAALQSFLTGTLTARATAAQLALTAAQAAQTSAEQIYQAAQATELTALSAVQAICPDFLSTSVCTVPG